MDGIVIIVAVGQPDQSGTDPGDCFNFVIAGVQIGYYLIGGQLGIVGVGVGMIHDLMAGIVEGLDGFGIFVYPFSDHEKCGRYLIFAQNINELLGVFVAPG